MEGVSGGRVGKIGNSASPSDGIYVIDYVAKSSPKGVYSRYGLDGSIDTGDENSVEFVHISLVKGATCVEDADKIVEEQRNNAKGKIADKCKIQPRGWMTVEDAVTQVK